MYRLLSLLTGSSVHEHQGPMKTEDDPYPVHIYDDTWVTTEQNNVTGIRGQDFHGEEFSKELNRISIEEITISLNHSTREKIPNTHQSSYMMR